MYSGGLLSCYDCSYQMMWSLVVGAAPSLLEHQYFVCTLRTFQKGLYPIMQSENTNTLYVIFLIKTSSTVLNISRRHLVHCRVEPNEYLSLFTCKSLWLRMSTDDDFFPFLSSRLTLSSHLIPSPSAESTHTLYVHPRGDFRRSHISRPVI